MLSFTFNELNSYEDFKIIIERWPVLPTPKRRVHYIEIPGRNSKIWYDECTYDDFNILVECAIKDNSHNLTTRLSNIREWLYEAGESELKFSFQTPEESPFKAQVVNSIDFKPIYKRALAFSIMFTCRPPIEEEEEV